MHEELPELTSGKGGEGPLTEDDVSSDSVPQMQLWVESGVTVWQVGQPGTGFLKHRNVLELQIISVSAVISL